jgi:hypothetical protein
MAGGALSYSHTWTVHVQSLSLTGVTISGPATGLTGHTDTFTATVEPQSSADQVTYTWSPEPGSGQGTPHASYTWHTVGTHRLSVTAALATGTPMSDTHQVEVELGERTLFLPVVYVGSGR